MQWYAFCGCGKGAIVNAMYALCVCAEEQLNRKFYYLLCFIMSLFSHLCILTIISINHHFSLFSHFSSVPVKSTHHSFSLS